MSQTDPFPLIPRRLIFGNPSKALVTLSPDGQSLAYLAEVDGVLNVWVGPTDNHEAAQPITNDAERGIRFYSWAYTNHHLIYIQDVGGDENWRVYCVNLTTQQTLDLTPFAGVQARLQGLSPRFPHEILIGLNTRTAEFHDLYRVNLDSGASELVQQNDGFLNFITDDDYQVRFGLTVTPDGGKALLQPTATGQWQPFLDIGLEDEMTTFVAGFDQSGQQLYMLDSRGRNTAALMQLDLTSGQQTLLAENEQADLSGLLIHPTKKTAQAVSFTYQRQTWQLLDTAIEADFAYLRQVAQGDMAITNRTLDDSRWIVTYANDVGPTHYYRYERATQTAHYLFASRPTLDKQPLVPMHSTIIPSRDGLDLISYYSLPPDQTAAKPTRPLPMVLLVHGGPWGRDQWGYHGEHQWLANRGYAVLSVNFRGSTGFGKAFVNLADKQWGGTMQDDLVDAVAWAIDEGLADPARIAIMGASYGGYATLVGLTMTPDLFACGVDNVGPSNLKSLLESIPPYWKPMFENLAQRIGDPRTEAGQALLEARSPLTHVDHIQRPLLIAQGANDPRVKQAEADQIVSAMEERAIPVTYLLYEDEGHGLARPENQRAFYAVAEAFLAEHLGGRYEPIGDDFDGSSIDVFSGADEVPGLAEKET